MASPRIARTPAAATPAAATAAASPDVAPNGTEISPARVHVWRVLSMLAALSVAHAEDKIRIVLDGLRGEDSIAELCRKEGIAQSLYYTWSKEFMEAGKRRLAGDTARAATADEVQDLRREAGALKEVVADLVLENRLLKKSMTGAGDDEA